MGINEADESFNEVSRELIFDSSKPLHVEDSKGRILRPWRTSQLGVAGVDDEGDLVFVPWNRVEIVWQGGPKED